MKFAEIFFILNTDDYWVTVDGDIDTTVHIEGSTKEAVHALMKFFEYTVERITPIHNAVEIDLISK